MKKLALLLSLFLTLPANSSLFVEPYLGLGKPISEQMPGANTSFDSFSINPGLRLGVTTMFTFIAIGGEFSYQDSTVEENSSEREIGLTRSDYSLFGVFEFPVLFRLFGKFIIGSDLKIGSTEVIDPTGYGFGVGYTGLPFLSMNLEYRNLTWNKIKINGSESSRDGEITELILSLSFPLKI